MVQYKKKHKVFKKAKAATRKTQKKARKALKRLRNRKVNLPRQFNKKLTR